MDIWGNINGGGGAGGDPGGVMARLGTLLLLLKEFKLL
jgi:hypothetical protein